MLRNRIIFSLIYNNGAFMQSRNFRLQRVGDINWLEKNYKFQQIAGSLDELVVVNASRGEKDMAAFSKIVSRLVDDVFIPVTAGGGIRCIEDAEILFNCGADKIILNSALVNTPEVAQKIVEKYGSQSLVASIDYKLIGNEPVLFIKDGTTQLEKSFESYIEELHELNVGEVYLNSIDKDGTGFGYDLETINRFANKFSMPLIVAGGAGNEKHLLEAIQIDNVAAVATANLFNFVGRGLPVARQYMIKKKANLACWN